ncbi:hypothetical protein [Geothrix fuzhouensis]|uniref:hypothetical protein n=1 Tax=Geothrix fuzhouensis TaxID=2966451 RepID=UPI0021491984|nr:hypothetical protein [Geothrix fuzhouensis]
MLRHCFMASTLRDLLIQRAARLQGRPALTTADWGTLTYAQLRNRTEGVALGLLATSSPSAIFSSTRTAWDWAAELAAAASGLAWDPAGQPVPPEVLGGPHFNNQDGRGPYHACEHELTEATPFSGGLTHGELMLRLRRLNTTLGWDHDTRVELPLARLGEPALRAALWSLLYAGGHAVLVAEAPAAQGLLARFRRPEAGWDLEPFSGFWTP